MNSCFGLTTGIKGLQPFETHPTTVANAPLKNTGTHAIWFIPRQVVQLWFHSIIGLRFMSALHYCHGDRGYQGAEDRGCLGFMTCMKCINALGEEKLTKWYLQCSSSLYKFWIFVSLFSWVQSCICFWQVRNSSICFHKTLFSLFVALHLYMHVKIVCLAFHVVMKLYSCITLISRSESKIKLGVSVLWISKMMSNGSSLKIKFLVISIPEIFVMCHILKMALEEHLNVNYVNSINHILS